MEKITPSKWPKKRIWIPNEETQGSLASNFEQDNPIPNWEKFKIEDIAKVKLWWESIVLKEVLKDENGRNYMNIQWRKYYEYKWTGAIPKSIYIPRWNSIFIWDKMSTLPYWEWVFIKCINESWETIHMEQRKTRYNAWDKSMHMEKLYKCATYLPSETIVVVKKSWTVYRIKKPLIDRYLNGEANEEEISIIEYTIRKNPEFCAYMEDLKDRQKQNQS